MNVLLLHLDGKIPNLALMKLHAHHRAKGDHVELRRVGNVGALQPRLTDPSWDRVYGSLIFERSRALAERARTVYPHLELGGTGWDFRDGVQVSRTDLPPDIEALAPDYSGYPRHAASLGFTQRGCRLACKFCVVPSKEGRVTPVGTLQEIWRGGDAPKHLVLLDNDFFGNPHWRDVIAEAIAGDYALSVIQGINARMLGDEEARAIASVRWMDGKFKRTRVYTAWDGRKDERRLFRGLEALVHHGIAPDSIMVYMLIGHEPGETHADRDYRRQKLRDFGCRPYPMPYVRDSELRAFARWVVQRKDVTDEATGKPFVPWDKWWGVARGDPRKLGTRRVSLPLFPDEED